MKIKTITPVVLSFLTLMYTCSYFLADTHRIFAEGLSSDNLMSAYYYQLYANSFESGFPVQKMNAFDHPSPHNIQDQFPSTFDAQLFAPIMALDSWPTNWAYLHTLILGIGWISWLSLGWALGCRGWLLAALGIQGFLFRPMWTQFLLGRYNLVFSSLLVLAIALLLMTQKRYLTNHTIPLTIRILSILLFVPIALWGFLLYPPFAIMMLPFGVYVAIQSIQRNKGSQWYIAGLIFIACICAVPFVQSIASSQSSQIGQCNTNLCPVPATILTWSRIQPFTQDIALPSMSIARENWWMLIISILAVQSWRRLFLLLLPITLILLSMGPCPDTPVGKAFLEGIWNTIPSLSCMIPYIHDLSRLGMIGMLFIPFCYVLCVKRNGLTTAIFVLITIHLLWRSHYEIGESPYWWKAEENHPIIQHIEKNKPGVIVELPFDQALQFISAIHNPNVSRINPWAMNAKPPISNESLSFLYEAGYEQSVQSTPSREGFEALGLNVIYYDKQRCRKTKLCREIPEKFITPVLGSPTILSDGSLLWQILK